MSPPYQADLLQRGHADRFFLGEYKLLERIGQGRMAGVYRATHRHGFPVAIKVLPPSKMSGASGYPHCLAGANGPSSSAYCTSNDGYACCC